jgi:predicted permease
MPRIVPRIAHWTLRIAAPAGDRDAILSDLEEEAAARADSYGIADARRWSRRQALRSAAPLLGERARRGAAAIRRTQMHIWRGLLGDVTLSLRRLAKAPAFAAVCIATLALGIGGNTAVFTLMDRVMLKSLAVARPGELYRLGNTDACCVNAGFQGSFSLFSYDLYRHLRDASPELTNVAAFQANTGTVTIGRPEGDTPAEPIRAVFVSGNYFQLFELTPAAGRLLQPSDDRPGAPAVAVLSFPAWTDMFQRRTDIIGQSFALNGVPVTIAGVAPPSFYGETLRPNPPGIWIPLSAEPALRPAARLLDAKGSHWLYAMGRIKPGTPLAPIDARLTATLQHWITSTLEVAPEERSAVPRQHIVLTPAAGGVATFSHGVEPALRLLFAIAAAVLLIACANLANLLLTHGMARRTETAVRVALGAPRARLIVQFLVESLLLAVVGGIAGLWVAYAAARGIVALTFRGATYVPIDPTPSLLVVGFAFAVSLVTGIVFGVAPAVVGSRTDPIEAMRGAGRSTAERGQRVRRGLVALQVALSLVLVTCAGLLGRSLTRLESQDFGFQRAGRYLVDLAPLGSIPQDRLQALYAAMQDRLGRVPGVTNVAYSLYSPMSGDNWEAPVTVEGRPPTERLSASWNRVSPRYFETIGTPLVRGRAITEHDGPGSRPVTVVSRAFARKFFGDEDPIGRHVGFGTDPASRVIEIVGVVGDAKYADGWEAPRAMFFLPFLQRSGGHTMHDRTELDRSHYPAAMEIQVVGATANLEHDIRAALAEVDRRITVEDVISQGEQIDRQFALDTLTARLTGAFGGMALLLACLGLYGVTAYNVTRRTREIGIRMAVGASAPEVLRTVLRGALAQLGLGVLIGLPATYIAGRLLQAQLFDVDAHDPIIMLAAVGVLAAAAIAASLLPARRAAAMDPVRALRVE